MLDITRIEYQISNHINHALNSGLSVPDLGELKLLYGCIIDDKIQQLLDIHNQDWFEWMPEEVRTQVSELHQEMCNRITKHFKGDVFATYDTLKNHRYPNTMSKEVLFVQYLYEVADLCDYQPWYAKLTKSNQPSFRQRLSELLP